MLFILSVIAFLSIIALLGVLAWIDHRYYLLPNIYNFGLFISFLIFHFATGWYYLTVEEACLGAFVGGAFLLIVRFVANVSLKKDTVGLGDVKFLIAAGFGVGMPNILLVLSFGALLGILHGVILQRFEKSKTGVLPNLMTLNVPAGVGLCFATAGLICIEFWQWWELFE